MSVIRECFIITTIDRTTPRNFPGQPAHTGPLPFHPWRKVLHRAWHSLENAQTDLKTLYANVGTTGDKAFMMEYAHYGAFTVVSSDNKLLKSMGIEKVVFGDDCKLDVLM